MSFSDYKARDEDKYVLEIPCNPTDAPTNTRKKEILCSDFMLSTVKFIDNHFRGTINLTAKNYPFGNIKIVPELFAHFIKVLIYEVKGNDLIKATMDFSQTRVNVIIRGANHLKFRANLAEYAKKSGFDVLQSEDVLFLTIEVEEQVYLFLNSRNPSTFYSYYLGALFDQYMNKY